MIQFDRTLLLTLKRREDRRKRFWAEVDRFGDKWPFERPQEWWAIDGAAVDVPSWVQPRHGQRYVSDGAWGCTLSYLLIAAQALSEGLDSVLVFEDDAWFVDDFPDRVAEFLDEVPEDWDAIYIGGHPRNCRQFPPVRVSDRVVRPYKVTATHCIAMRSGFMRAMTGALLDMPPIICDARMAELHTIRDETNDVHRGRFNIYSPMEPLVGQVMGYSDIASNSAGESRSIWGIPNTVRNLLRKPGDDVTERVDLLGNPSPLHG